MQNSIQPEVCAEAAGPRPAVPWSAVPWPPGCALPLLARVGSSLSLLSGRSRFSRLSPWYDDVMCTVVQSSMMGCSHMAVLMGAALGRSDEAMQHSSCGRPVAGEREVSGRANVGPTSTAHAAGSGWLLLAAPGVWAPGWLLVVLQPTMAVHVHGCSYSCMAALYTPPATCSWGAGGQRAENVPWPVVLVWLSQAASHWQSLAQRSMHWLVEFVAAAGRSSQPDSKADCM